MASYDQFLAGNLINNSISDETIADNMKELERMNLKVWYFYYTMYDFNEKGANRKVVPFLLIFLLLIRILLFLFVVDLLRFILYFCHLVGKTIKNYL